MNGVPVEGRLVFLLGTCWVPAGHMLGTCGHTVKQEIFAAAIFRFLIVIKFCQNTFLGFLLLMYRQSIEQQTC